MPRAGGFESVSRQLRPPLVSESPMFSQKVPAELTSILGIGYSNSRVEV
jgi:hypothetical protein